MSLGNLYECMALLDHIHVCCFLLLAFPSDILFNFLHSFCLTSEVYCSYFVINICLYILQQNIGHQLSSTCNYY